MRIIVAGGSGFIGHHLIAALVADGHVVTILTRAQPESSETPGGLLHSMHWDPRTADSGLAEVLAGADAVINLAGSNIGSRRWTPRRKIDLLNSRIRATETLVRAIALLEESRRPRTLVNASGIDFYGDRGDEVLTEGSDPGDTFLARVCERWEHAATAAQPLGVRVVLMRKEYPRLCIPSWISGWLSPLPNCARNMGPGHISIALVSFSRHIQKMIRVLCLRILAGVICITLQARPTLN